MMKIATSQRAWDTITGVREPRFRYNQPQINPQTNAARINTPFLAYR